MTFIKLIISAILVVIALAYGISPVDFIPDVLPVLGWADDAGVGLLAAFLLKAMWSTSPKPARSRR